MTWKPIYLTSCKKWRAKIVTGCHITSNRVRGMGKLVAGYMFQAAGLTIVAGWAIGGMYKFSGPLKPETCNL